MTRRLFFMVWIVFAATLVVPLTVFVFENIFNFRWRSGQEIHLEISTVILTLSPTVFGIAVTVHTLRTRQYRRTAIALGLANTLVGVLPYALLLVRRGLLLPDIDEFPYLFDWWWVSSMQTTLAAVLTLRLISSWSPSFWSRGARVAAMVFLGLGVILLGFVIFNNLVLERQYVDPTYPQSLPLPFSVLGWILTGIAVFWSSTERALGERWRKDERTLDKRVPVRLDCPKCGGSVDVLSRVLKRCASCGLGVEVRLDEPRCACGYLMYGFSGDRCPECGVAVPDDLRWWDAKPGESAHPPLSDREPSARPEGD